MEDGRELIGKRQSNHSTLVGHDRKANLIGIALLFGDLHLGRFRL